MRTTLDIDGDVLQAAKEVAANRGTTAGKVLSEWARQTLESRGAKTIRNGVPVLPKRARARKLTLELVNRLRDKP